MSCELVLFRSWSSQQLSCARLRTACNVFSLFAEYNAILACTRIHELIGMPLCIACVQETEIEVRSALITAEQQKLHDDRSIV